MDVEMKLVVAMGVAAIVGGVCQVWILLDRLATRRAFRGLVAGSGAESKE